MHHVNEINEALTIPVTRAAALLGVSRVSAYRAARSGELPAIKIGHRVLILRSALERLVGAPIAVASPGDVR